MFGYYEEEQQVEEEEEEEPEVKEDDDDGREDGSGGDDMEEETVLDVCGTKIGLSSDDGETLEKARVSLTEFFEHYITAS